jgi:hypothetical protein
MTCTAAEPPTADQFELYAMGCLGDANTVSFEEHLLVCGRCRSELADNDSYVTVIRSVLSRDAGRIAHRNAPPPALDAGVHLVALHATAEGTMLLCVHPSQNVWAARVVGGAIDFGRWHERRQAAVSDCARLFWEAFPEHICGSDCIANKDTET